MSTLTITSLRRLLDDGVYPLDSWEAQALRYERYSNYFLGYIFAELSDPENSESPLRFPLKYNMVRTFSEKLAAYLFGQLDEDIVRFAADPRLNGRESPSAEATDLARRFSSDLMEIYRDNDHNLQLARAAIDMENFGGVFLKGKWDPFQERVVVEALPPDICYPKWHPLDVTQLEEMMISYPMLKADAERLFRVTFDGYYSPIVLYREEWTKDKIKIWLENRLIKNDPNPYGMIPFEYFPRYQILGEFYGLSVTEQIMGLQDEINLRLADIGDGVNYNQHPTRVVTNFKGKTSELPVGPDAVWNLGSSIGGTEPKASILEAKGNYQQGMDFVNVILQLAQDVAHLPAITFGRDEGSQRSGMTLHIRMLPLTQMTEWTRAHWSASFNRLNKKLLWIYYTFNHKDGLAQEALKHRYKTQWHEILPKDEQLQAEREVNLVKAWLQDPVEAMMNLHKISRSDAEKRWRDALPFFRIMAELQKPQQEPKQEM